KRDALNNDVRLARKVLADKHGYSKAQLDKFQRDAKKKNEAIDTAPVQEKISPDDLAVAEKSYSIAKKAYRALTSKQKGHVHWWQGGSYPFQGALRRQAKGEKVAAHEFTAA